MVDGVCRGRRTDGEPTCNGVVVVADTARIADIRVDETVIGLDFGRGLACAGRGNEDDTELIAGLQAIRGLKDDASGMGGARQAEQQAEYRRASRVPNNLRSHRSL